MGRHVAVASEMSPSNVEAVTERIPLVLLAGDSSGVPVLARPGWSSASTVAVVVALHAMFSSASLIVAYPQWLYWMLVVPLTGLAVGRSRVIDARLVVSMCAAVALFSLAFGFLLDFWRWALGFRVPSAVSFIDMSAHIGSVVIALALCACWRHSARDLMRRWVTARSAWGAGGVAVALALALTALLPIGQVVTSGSEFGVVTDSQGRQIFSSAGATPAATTALGCSAGNGAATGTASVADRAEPGCTRRALIQRVCHLDINTMDAQASTPTGISLWLDAAHANMAKFSTRFDTSVPFTQGGIECVDHETSPDGSSMALAHSLTLSAADWDALSAVGPLPARLEQKIANA